MPRIAYESTNIKKRTLAMIEAANEIIDQYAHDGFQLTLRQLYYQFVSRDLLPNNERSYKQLGDAISTGRMNGLIDWEAITDRTREKQGRGEWKDPTSILKDASKAYRIDLWKDQPVRPEVWVEKDALSDIVKKASEPLGVNYMVCRGYTSSSAMWESAMRFRKQAEEGQANNRELQVPMVLYLGDHDPSGIDMTRDVEERLTMFCMEDNGDAAGIACPVGVTRIALTMDQIEEFNPPPNPTKVNDARARKYIQEYGLHSWELDALEPKMLVELIRRSIEACVKHRALFEDRKKQEATERKLLTRLHQQWGDVLEVIED